MIDNYDEAIALTEKLKANLPIFLKPTPETVAQLQEQGLKTSKNQAYEVKSLIYSRDAGGIVCELKQEDKNAPLLISLTHLRIENDHPLADEVKVYQNRRSLRLAVADGKIGKAARLRKKVKKKKGFGTL